MKNPFTRRREQRRLLQEAEKRLTDVEADWDRVREHAGLLREQKELNHYTSMAAAIFGYQSRGRHSA